jgi:hypothetical protein
MRICTHCLQRSPDDADSYLDIPVARGGSVRTRRSILLIPVLGLAAALAACGGGGVKKTDFTAKADAACSPGNSAIAAAAKPSNAAQVGTAAGTAATTIDAQVVALRALETPGGKDKAQIDGVIGAIGEAGPPAKALQEAAGKSDNGAMAKAAVELQSKVDTASSQAQAYGLGQCGTGLKPAVAPLFEGTRSVVKNDYVAKGEALCRESLRKSDALPQPSATLTSLHRFIDRYLPIYERFIADFKAVPVPPGDGGTIGEITAALDGALPKIKEISAAAKANNSRLVGALFEELGVAGTALDAKLDAYGLKACGSLGGF